jgi:hypothetical protein
MTRGTQCSVVLAVLFGVALLAFAGPAVATDGAGTSNSTLGGEGGVDTEQTGSFDIAVEPASLETAPGSVSTYEVVIYGATNGIEGYDNIRLSIDDPTVGQFVGFFETANNNEGETGPLSKTEIRDGNGNPAEEGPVFFMEAGLLDKTFAGADRIVIAELDIEALGTTGETSAVNISESVDGVQPTIQNLDEDVQTADELNPSSLSVTNLSVDVLDTSTPVVGGDLEVDVEVENIAGVTETQQVSVATSPDIGSASTTVTLAPGDTTVETLSVSTQSGDEGDYTVTATSDNSADSAAATVLAEPGFAVDVLSTNEPVEGDDIQVEFEVENVDNVEDTQQVSLTTSPDIGSASTTVTLGGGDTTVETLSIPTQSGEDGDYTVTVTSNEDTASATVSVLRSPEFLVNITAVGQEVVAGDLLSVNYTVENTGEVQETQDIEFSVNGSVEKTTTNVTVTAGATIARSFTYETTEGDVPAVDVAVTSADDTDTETVPVGEPPFFEVAITNVDGPVVEGESLTVDYEVTNTGDAEGTQAINFTVDGVEQGTDPGITLASGNSSTGQFTYQTTDGDAPNLTVEVASDDDTATSTVTVDEPPLFEVALTGVDSEVTEGENLTVDYEVTNTGDVEGTQDIEFTVDGTSEGTEAGVTLGAGATFDSQFTYETVDGDAPEVSVAVASANDTATDTVTVNEPPFFDVVIAFIDKEVTAGDPLTVAYTVTNTGDVEDTQDITLELNGTTEATETGLTLTAGETTSDQFVYTTESGDVPALAATVASENVSDSDTVPVNEPPFFDVAITNVDDAVTEGATVSVDYEVTNTGDVEDTQDITLAVNGTDEATDPGQTLGGDETTSGSFTYETSDGDAPAVEVSVASDDDTATDTVTVNEPPFFEVAITSVDDAVTEGDALTVDYEVTNTGGVEATQDITFTVNGTTEGTDAGVTLAAGGTFDGAFTYETVTGEAPEVTVAVASANDTATDTVIVNEPPLFDVAITSVDSAVTAGETVTVDYEVTNTGDVEATQNVTFSVDGATEDTDADVTLGGNETATGQFSYQTAGGDTPSITVAVASADDSETATVTVEDPPFFAVTITGIDQEVPQGAEVNVDYQVENTGDAEDTQNITFTVNGTTEAVDTGVTLDGGETFGGTFVYATETGDTPQITVAVESNDDAASETVDVNEEAIFAVVVTDIDGAVTAGETVTVDYEVTNTGDVQDSQDITFVVDGVTEDTDSDVTLGGNETATGQFSYQTAGSDVPAVNIQVASADDAAERTVTVNQPAFFAVEITEVEGSVTAGETVALGYAVENTGDVEATQDITFTVNGTAEGTETDVTLGGGETFSGQFTYETGAGDTPAIAVTVASTDETAGETVSVLEAATGALSNLDIAGQGSNATVVVGAEENVTATVTNAGDQAGTFTVTVEIGTAVTLTGTTSQLAGGASETLTFANATGALGVGEYGVTVGTANDSLAGTLTVNEAAATEVSGLDIASKGETVLIAGGDEENVTATVTNVGGQADSFGVTLEIATDSGSPVLTETRTVSLGPGVSTQVTFEAITGGVPTAVLNYTVSVSTADDAVQGELTVWPDVTDDGKPATDTTGDKRLNNVDGDDKFDIFDVQALFKNFEDDVVQDLMPAFNFNDDSPPKVTIFDVQSLFNQL